MSGFFRRRLDPTERYGLRLTLFAVAFVLLALPFTFLLIQVLSKGSLLSVDRSIERSVHDVFRSAPGWVRGLKLITFLGSTPWLIGVTSVGVLVLWRAHRTRMLVYLITTASIGSVMNWTVKQVVDRARPVFSDPFVIARGRSFPSGHAMSSTVVYGALVIALFAMTPPRWRPTAIASVVALVLAIGFTRIALGVHFLSDVLAGYALGLAWLVASTGAFRVWRASGSERAP